MAKQGKHFKSASPEKNIWASLRLGRFSAIWLILISLVVHICSRVCAQLIFYQYLPDFLASLSYLFYFAWPHSEHVMMNKNMTKCQAQMEHGSPWKENGSFPPTESVGHTGVWVTTQTTSLCSSEPFCGFHLMRVKSKCLTTACKVLQDLNPALPASTPGTLSHTAVTLAFLLFMNASSQILFFWFFLAWDPHC